MKQKIFAVIATSLIVMAGVITPLFGVVSNTFQVRHAYAQLVDGPVGTNTSGYQGPGGGPNGEGAELGPSTVTSVGDPTTPSGGEEAAGGTPTEIECGLNFICAAVLIASQVFMFLPNLLATVTGLVMDFTMWHSLQSSTYTAYDGDVGDEGIVVTGWKLVRDFSNILFIFALFVIAFTLILGLDDRGEGAPMGLDPKRTIARVIIMALLVNFSFFLGRSVIDLTNIVGLTFYNKITAAPQATLGETLASSSEVNGGPGDPGTFYENAAGIRSISTGILAQVNPQSLLLSNKDVKGTGWLWKSYDWSTYISIYFLSFVSFAFNIFLIYIFGSLAILFIARTIGLFLGIIISPIAFVSYTIPALQKKSFIGFDDWLKQFLGLAFMAPIFLFFLYISLQFFHISGLDKGSGYLATTAQILVKLALIGFLLVYSKNVAKDLSGKMGEMTTNAITSVATGAAIVAGAVATGGLSGAARLGGRMLKEKVVAGGDALGGAAFGQERYAAMQKQWKINGGVKNFINSTPSQALTRFTKIARAGETEPSFLSSLSDNFRQAGVANRVYDKKANAEALAKAKAEKEKKDNIEIAKKTKDIDKDLEQLKKDLDAGVITPKEYNEERKKKAQERKDIVAQITDPAFAEKRAQKNANDAHREAKKEAMGTATGKELTRAQSRVTVLDTRLAMDTTALNKAIAKLAAATTARTEAETAATNAETALNNAIASGADAAEITRLTTALTEAETRKTDAIAAETAAINTKDAADATFQTTNTNRLDAVTERTRLEGQLNRENPELALLKTLVDDAEAAVKNKKEEVDITEEIRKRTIVPKTDTVSRQNNDVRVKKLQDRLREITGGGATPPTTP